MPFRVHIVHEADPRLLMRLDAMHSALERLGGQVATVLKNQGVIMASLDDILADVTAESAGIDSLGVLITQLKEQITGLTSGNLPPDVQAKVDAIFTQAEANKGKIMAAINANGPAPTPAPTPAPAPSSLSSSGPSAASGT